MPISRPCKDRSQPVDPAATAGAPCYDHRWNGCLGCCGAGCIAPCRRTSARLVARQRQTKAELTWTILTIAQRTETMAPSRSTLSISIALVSCAIATWGLAQPAPPASELPTQPPDASPHELRVLGGRTDYSIVTPKKASPQEL